MRRVNNRSQGHIFIHPSVSSYESETLMRVRVSKRAKEIGEEIYIENRANGYFLLGVERYTSGLVDVVVLNADGGHGCGSSLTSHACDRSSSNYLSSRK